MNEDIVLEQGSSDPREITKTLKKILQVESITRIFILGYSDFRTQV